MQKEFWRIFNNFLEILFFPWLSMERKYDRQFVTAAIIKIIAVIFIARSILDLVAGGFGGMVCNLIPGFILYGVGCRIQYGKIIKD
jgi:hypothetical protein